ncbi:type II secretion system F family protein [Corynebacterium sp. SCR221107]|uniref:type II secretion system F family protein n=1 Tax=Corynebacterium sp. SCR221107 TaxID=3017361 RepID=UPI0022EC6D39|nr:type II secretion system F family protein [Corynebacterium sp. SCR221107]WBT09046.1 type II secretion system F family protein [Corynebacterium sp. SCR221107]
MSGIILGLAIATALVITEPRSTRLVRIGQGPRTPRDGPRRSTRGKKAGEHLARAGELELVAACLRSGLSPQAAAQVVAESTGTNAWAQVATMLRLGVDPITAWDPIARLEGCQEMALIARNSHRSGAAMATSCRNLAATLDDAAWAEAESRAERAGVLIAIPLALFFLPAFIVLGLAPVVITLGQGMAPL